MRVRGRRIEDAQVVEDRAGGMDGAGIVAPALAGARLAFGAGHRERCEVRLGQPIERAPRLDEQPGRHLGAHRPAAAVGEAQLGRGGEEACEVGRHGAHGKFPP